MQIVYVTYIIKHYPYYTNLNHNEFKYVLSPFRLYECVWEREKEARGGEIVFVCLLVCVGVCVCVCVCVCACVNNCHIHTFFQHATRSIMT